MGSNRERTDSRTLSEKDSKGGGQRGDEATDGLTECRIYFGALKTRGSETTDVLFQVRRVATVDLRPVLTRKVRIERDRGKD